MRPIFIAASYNEEANDLTSSLDNNPLGAQEQKQEGSFLLMQINLLLLPSYCREFLFSLRVEFLLCCNYYSPLEVRKNKLYRTREQQFLPIH
jgi:hypothetical protein